MVGAEHKGTGKLPPIGYFLDVRSLVHEEVDRLKVLIPQFGPRGMVVGVEGSVEGEAAGVRAGAAPSSSKKARSTLASGS